MIKDTYQIQASLLNCQLCCDTKKGISFDILADSFEQIIECGNCNTKISSFDVPCDKDLFEAWNEVIIERDRKARNIVKAEVNEYPFVFAMK